MFQKTYPTDITQNVERRWQRMLDSASALKREAQSACTDCGGVLQIAAVTADASAQPCNCERAT